MLKNKFANTIVKLFVKLFFLLGPFLLTAGLTIGIASEKWGIIPLSLLITGIVICGLWLILKLRETQWLEKRSTQSGTNAIIATVSVVAILAMINFLGIRYHLRLDLTDNQLFTLAPQSRELVTNLSQPVKLWLFTTQKNTQDQELLKNYTRESSNFQYEYVDPQLKPGLAKKFNVKQDGDVYLEFNNQQKLVQNINQNQPLSEVRITNTLQQITTSTSVKIYFLQGHGEIPISDTQEKIPEAIKALNERNFTTLPLNLTSQPQVPVDAAAVVVAGPQRGLLLGEVTALQNYLKRGGNLLLMLDPNKDSQLDPLLKDWGITLDQRLIIDNSGESLGLGPAAILVTEYGEHPITKDFGNGISVYPLSRPLVVTSVPNVESMTLLKTKPFPNSWAESDQNSEKLEFNEGKDLKGPLTLAVVLRRKLSVIPTVSPTSPASPISTPTNSPSSTNVIDPNKNTNTNNKESRLVVFGNSSFISNNLFRQQLNADVFLNSVTWVSQQDQQTLSIRPKEQKNRRIIISTNEANILSIVAICVLPVLSLIVGVIIWWIRR